MKLQQEQIHEQQKQVWNKVSAGWKKWDRFIMDFLRPVSDSIIEKLEIEEEDVVLDIAAGTGEPGLTIASIAKNGKVVGTDLAEEMLRLADANAAAKGIKNYSTQVADVCKLPFDDNTFTKISCRMGFMFFPDMQLAANEMYRVLKPGGRIAIAVWSAPDKNFWYIATINIVKKYIDQPITAPDAPGMFRCSKPGLMTGIFSQAGFKHTGEDELTGKVDFVDADTYWQNRTDLSESLIAMLAKADDVTIEAIKKDVYSLINTHTVNGRTLLDFGAITIYGEK